MPSSLYRLVKYLFLRYRSATPIEETQGPSPRYSSMFTYFRLLASAVRIRAKTQATRDTVALLTFSKA